MTTPSAKSNDRTGAPVGSLAITLIATVRNERGSIREFIDSLLKQQRPPDELIIVDGKSNDGTAEILQEYASAGRLLLISEDCNIAHGRNLGIAAASHEHIAVTDAGCRADPDWLAQIEVCFLSEQRPDVIAGNYAFDTHSCFEEASVYATDTPGREDGDLGKYYPSSRSVAFTKTAWKAVDGYPDWLYAAEDTLFNIRLRQKGFRFAFARNAIVRWRPRRTWKALYKQYYNYARGNGRIGLGIFGYIANIQTHALILASVLGSFAWRPLAIVALAFAADHIRRRLWQQASYARQQTGSIAMFLHVLLAMEVVRIGGMAGFIAGRLDRWRDPKFIRRQREWMGVSSLEPWPPLPSLRKMALAAMMACLLVAIIHAWRFAVLAPAGVVTLLLVIGSLRNFSRTGPQLKDEIQTYYRAYAMQAFARLVLWSFALSVSLAGVGALALAGYGAAAELGAPPIPLWLAATISLVLVTCFQFCRHLVLLPASIAASLNYRLSRFYPLWNLLSPGALKAIAIVALTALLAIIGIGALRWLLAGNSAGCTMLLGITGLYIALFLLSEWVPEPAPVTSIKRAEPSDTRMNVLMIGADTLRADRLGVAGYKRPLTPFMDYLMSQGTYLSQCYVPCARTAPSLLSLLSGTWPKTHRIRDNFALPQDANTDIAYLPQVFRDAGYRTIAISDWAGADLGKYPLGFDVRELPDDQWNIKYLIRQGPKDVRLFLSLFTHNWFGRKFLPELYYLAGVPMTDELGLATRRHLRDCATRREPFFLNVFLSTTHAPFGTEHPYYTMFAGRDYSGPSKFVMAGLSEPFEVVERQRERAENFDLAQIIDLYDACVRRFDDEVKRIVEHLDKCGLAESTIVVVYSDHGIEFFERDTWGQGNSVVVDESAHIPVIILDPRYAKPKVISGITRNVDIAPTLLELVGLPVPPTIEGMSLSSTIRAELPPPQLEAFAETGLWFDRLPGMDEAHATLSAAARTVGSSGQARRNADHTHRLCDLCRRREGPYGQGQQLEAHLYADAGRHRATTVVRHSCGSHVHDGRRARAFT